MKSLANQYNIHLNNKVSSSHKNMTFYIANIVRVALFTIVIFIVEIMEEDLPCPIEAIDNGLKSEMVI